jgi:hypothetical protein
MVFEYAVNVSSNRDRLHWIAQQVADHAYASGVWKLDKYGDVRTVVSKRLVRGMPDTLPTEDPAARLDFGPFGIERVTMMTEPLGTELPSVAVAAALHQQPVLAQTRPVGS